MSQDQKEPVDWRDLIEREPPGWGALPIIAGVVVLIFFVLIPWLLTGWTR
jgi:hypothetical protein